MMIKASVIAGINMVLNTSVTDVVKITGTRVNHTETLGVIEMSLQTKMRLALQTTMRLDIKVKVDGTIDKVTAASRIPVADITEVATTKVTAATNKVTAATDKVIAASLTPVADITEAATKKVTAATKKVTATTNKVTAATTKVTTATIKVTAVEEDIAQVEGLKREAVLDMDLVENIEVGEDEEVIRGQGLEEVEVIITGTKTRSRGGRGHHHRN
ncbi:uncharacterized protein LOC121378748 [Gigantopelta aegis]|uniref:uncharacterized protein LOC121378748 n=1 Tax=Gigantopelta aegis TaxID=1735272 RepID=UPI001B889264|nr:uncharacterized protein LOC121378748 [Gigantopelta aegis]XP_041362974.1 uncharacterized protein LOC121378748 [Gigantopelta aegis]